MELIALNKKICTGCMACRNVCPEECIDIQKDELGFAYPHIDLSKCIDCNACNNICPAIKDKQEKPDLYSNICAAVSEDDISRKMSSSGGIFPKLAENIISQGGVVFGAKFNNDMVLRHVCIAKVEDISSLQGSKYVQSDMGECYKAIDTYINDGKKVLFCGTPCQTEGIRSCFPSENLITCAVVCHGVPSNKVFHDYVMDIEKKHNTKLVDIDFRNKDNSWRKYNIVPLNKNGAVSSTPVEKDKYMKGFIEGYYMRECCHNCPAKPVTADILLGDFWGVEHYMPDMDDDMGTSVVFANDNGLELVKACDGIRTAQVAFDDAVKYNKGIYTSAKAHAKREEFINYYQKKGYNKAVNRYLTPDGRVKYVIKKVLSKLDIIEY